ncbi:MAG: hypothetical protein ACKO3G_08650 [Planctomycetaceae bacterium]
MEPQQEKPKPSKRTGRTKVPQNPVWPNAEWFKAFVARCGGDTREAQRRLGIRSPQTWKRYTDPKDYVRASTLENAVKRVNATLRQVTCRPPHSRLIDQDKELVEKWFLGTWHSVYLDYNRQQDEFEGRPHWWRETIKFHPGPTPDPDLGRLRFRVGLTNAHGVAFHGVAHLLSDWQLVCSFVRDSTGSTADDESIVITFTERVRVPGKTAKAAAVDVLVGSWPGTDRGNANARIYRNLLSREPLSQEQIDAAAHRSLQVEKWAGCKVADVAAPPAAAPPPEAATRS